MNKVDKTHRMNGTKLLWHMDRVHEHFRDGKRIAPLYIDMGATKTCNINCVYCYGAYQNMSGEHIKKDALISLFETAPKIGIKGIGLIGDGEPTCNPHIYEAMDVGKKNGLDIAISTNGLLLTDDKKIENILRNCTWMRFNLSAGTKEGYLKIHRVDGFDILLKNIRRMIELKKEKGYKCEIGLQSVYVPGMMDEEMIVEAKLAVELGVDYFLIKQCSLPEGNESVNDIKFDIKDYNSPRVKEVLDICEATSTDNTKIIAKRVLMEQEGKRPYDGCLGIPLLVQISGNGDVFPCGHLFGKKEFLMGNIHDNNIKEIIESEKYWEVIKTMKNFDVHNDCKGACRQDKINEFIYNYVNPPRGINFI